MDVMKCHLQGFWRAFEETEDGNSVRKQGNLFGELPCQYETALQCFRGLSEAEKASEKLDCSSILILVEQKRFYCI
jgi:hypothetical protein